jgi:hypothetical protein
MQKKNLKPGTPAPASGEYERRGPRGGHGPEATVPKGHVLPPGPGPGYSYDLVRPARNQSGRGGK